MKSILINLTPERELGAFFGNLMHREQSIGEIRGLERLNLLIIARRNELEQRLNLQPGPKNIDQQEPLGNTALD